MKRIVTCLVLSIFFAPVTRAEPSLPPLEADVCIYAATPSGILSAIAVKRAGRSVVIVEPSRWVGGMLGAGLKPMQDCPNYAATGGLTRKLLPDLGKEAEPLVDGDRRSLDPKAIREDFQKLLDQHGISVVFDHRIATCVVENAEIRAAIFDLAPFDEFGCPTAAPEKSGHLRVSAKIFIDASYEGDLMPVAGVSFRVGRESVSEFDEEFAGVREPMEKAPIDPFVTPGDPKSGLLKWVEDDHGKPLGSADEYTQAYNYRYYTTANPDHRAPFSPPNNYSPQNFELVGRYIAYLSENTKDPQDLRKKLVGIFPGWKNSGEWNYQRSSLFSMSPLGISQLYASGNYEEKAAVWKAHQDYLSGLHHFISTDPRVPEAYRKEVAELGLDKRVHPTTGGWPHQLYIRVARRLEGRYTISAHDVYNRKEIDDPIGLAQYGIDTYPSRRIWGRDENGATWVGIEGKMFVGGSNGPTDIPYPIPYRAITPKTSECRNLLVPVCFSATHLGYASARMEPVFMICGESAGIAACHALDEATAVQEIDPVKYQSALKSAHQKLSWDPTTDRSPKEDPYHYDSILQNFDQDQNKSLSKSEWDAAKPGWEWLFPRIDTDSNHNLSKAEYDAFQDYKKKHSDWQEKLKNQMIQE